MPATPRMILPQAARAQQNGILSRAIIRDVCLPTQLRTALPSCSISCIQSFIANNYAGLSCSATANLNLLCSTKSSGGLTIGEGSLQCVISNCQGVNLLKQSGYTICSRVPGAILNMAETITATIDSRSTESPTGSQSVPSTFKTSTISSISITFPVVPTPTVASSEPVATISNIQPATSSTPIISSPPSLPATTRTTQDVSNTSTDSAISSFTSSTISSTSSILSTPRATTSTVAMTAGQQSGLNASAIAGIATAAVVVIGLLIGYMAYLWIVRRKENEKRRSQRFSTWFPLRPENNGNGPETAFEPQPNPSAPVLPQVPVPAMQDNRRSLWRRSAVPPTDIGVAVAASTRVSPEPVLRRNPQISWPSPVGAYPYETKLRDENRWSKATSFDEDQEAQTQDVPILGNSKVRSSARSFSSMSGVERPAPLRLSKVRPRADTPPSARIPLTPIYDNGNFDPTIRRVYDENDPRSLMVPRKSSFAAPNFSRREPSLTRSSQERSFPGPWTAQSQKNGASGRYPVKPNQPRKASEISIQSVSVYTDIEEDESPEQEKDKQLALPNTDSAGTRQPLKDLQYPQIPQSAVVTQQAQKTHSPRAALSIRQVSPEPGNDSMIDRGRNYYRSTSSSEQTTMSISPVFPMPPGRDSSPVNHRRTPAQATNNLARQISDAYKAASRPTTTTFKNSKPGEMYQQIQRLSSGRPLAQNLGSEGLTRKTTNRTPRNGDLYFTVPINTSIYGR